MSYQFIFQQWFPSFLIVKTYFVALPWPAHRASLNCISQVHTRPKQKRKQKRIYLHYCLFSGKEVTGRRWPSSSGLSVCLSLCLSALLLQWACRGTKRKVENLTTQASAPHFFLNTAVSWFASAASTRESRSHHKVPVA